MKKVSEKQRKTRKDWKEVVKRGRNKFGEQIYFSKATGKHFTEHKQPRGFDDDTKAKAKLLYLEGNSLRTIARILECSPSTVLRWIRDHHKVVIVMDEMWHFEQKKRKDCGSGSHLTK